MLRHNHLEWSSTFLGSAAVDKMSDLDATLMNIVEQETLNWIFVGGKGGKDQISIPLLQYFSSSLQCLASCIFLLFESELQQERAWASKYDD